MKATLSLVNSAAEECVCSVNQQESRCKHTVNQGDTHTVKAVLPEDSSGEENQADVFQVKGEGEEEHPEEGETVNQQGGNPVTQQQHNFNHKNSASQQHNIIPTSEEH